MTANMKSRFACVKAARCFLAGRGEFEKEEFTGP